MPLPWTLSLVGVVVVAVALRIGVHRLPLRAARPANLRRLATLGLGGLGLVAHCTAMFFTDLARAVPGSRDYVDAVNGMGGASMVLYAVPAVLVIAGLRQVPRWVLLAVGALLLGVGVTMYDGGPLTVHLTAILLLVIALTTTTAALVGDGVARRAGA